MALERHPHIRGLPLPGSSSVNVAAYADNITLYVHNEQSLPYALNTFQRYSSIFGARLNYSKSKYFFIGSPKARLQIATTLQWHPKIKMLGLFFDTSGIWDGMWVCHKYIKEQRSGSP